MGIPAGLTRVALSGKLGATEQWVSSFWATGHDASEASDSSAAAIIAASPFTGFRSQLAGLMSGDDSFEALDLYYYDGSGAAVAHGHATGHIVGTGGGNHPKQCSAVMTLRSSLSSRSGRGRMYLPATGVVVIAGGEMTHGDIDNTVDFLAVWFGALAAGGFVPVVLSQKLSASNAVTRVDADYVPDTQRRRRNKLVTTRHSHAV
jgi:hypothetical protein